MGKSQSLREEDVRAMLRLMSEIAQLPADPTLRTQHAVEGIGKLVHAKSAWTTRFRSNGLGQGIEPYCVLQSGWTGEEVEAVMEAAIHDPMHDFINDDLQTCPQRPLLSVPSRFDPERKRRRRDIRARIEEQVGGDLDVVVNCPAAAPGHFSALGLHRPREDRPFNDRELTIARMIWGELAFLHSRPIAAVEKKLWGTRLPPRLEQVLERLLAGDSAKQVAAFLQISTHTVNDHIKELYRRFGVSSRGELLAEFVRTHGTTAQAQGD